MDPANSQQGQPGGANNNGGGNPDPNAGGQGAGAPNTQQQQQPQNGNGNSNAPTFDPTQLTKEQINQVLEKNPEIWKADRIAQLRDKAGKYDQAEQARQETEQKQLQEQGKFKELSEKQAADNAELRKQLVDRDITQALTQKLAPLGVVDLEGALKLVDRSSLKVDDNGTVTGVDDAIKALQESKAYLFNGQANGTPSKVGNPTNPQDPNNGGSGAKFKRSQLSDPKFYAENREEILKAAQAGQIEDDVTGNPQT